MTTIHVFTAMKTSNLIFRNKFSVPVFIKIAVYEHYNDTQIINIFIKYESVIDDEPHLNYNRRNREHFRYHGNHLGMSVLCLVSKRY
jgi:hypothetical protein